MGHRIRITVEDVVLEAELNDSATAEAVLAALPIEASGKRWGEEIYFSIPVKEEEAPEARADLQVGELAYWPPGRAFCIFFGPTPVSSGEAPRAASSVNPIGRITDDVTPLKAAPDGAAVRIEKA
jgi:hypothetical protein